MGKMKHEMENVATPLWGKCEDETHTPKSGNLESSGTPKNLKLDYRGQNTCIDMFFILWERSWNVDVQNGLAWAIWTSQHKLWSKERPRVKLIIWLLTTKSRESTRPRCVQVQCDTLLESSWGELQVLLETSSQSEVWAKSYELPKSRKSKPG
jgi:hypothetical protein